MSFTAPTGATEGKISMVRIVPVVAFAFACAVGSTAVAGPDWVEGDNDAGSFFFSAQATLGAGALTSISGKLSAFPSLHGGGEDFEDIFLITITDPANFSITISNATFNAQLFLFHITLPGQLLGLLANDDTIFGQTPVLTSMSTDGSGAQLTAPGQYALAIAGAGRFPVSNTGAIFNFASPTEISGPDGPGGFNPLSDWSGIGEVGEYGIELEGVGFYDLPAPGVLGLLALAGVGGGRRRRRIA